MLTLLIWIDNMKVMPNENADLKIDNRKTVDFPDVWSTFNLVLRLYKRFIIILQYPYNQEKA